MRLFKMMKVVVSDAIRLFVLNSESKKCQKRIDDLVRKMNSSECRDDKLELSRELHKEMMCIDDIGNKIGNLLKFKEEK